MTKGLSTDQLIKLAGNEKTEDGQYFDLIDPSSLSKFNQRKPKKATKIEDEWIPSEESDTSETASDIPEAEADDLDLDFFQDKKPKPTYYDSSDHYHNTKTVSTYAPSNIRKGSWTDQEVLQMLAVIMNFSSPSVKTISNYIPQRSDSQIRYKLSALYRESLRGKGACGYDASAINNLLRPYFE